MELLDSVLLGLADPTGRAGLLDADLLLGVAGAMYDLHPQDVVGAPTAVVDTVDLMVPGHPEVLLAGQVRRATEPAPIEITAALRHLVEPEALCEAVWTGQVVVRYPVADAVIAGVGVAAWQSDGQHATTTLELEIGGPDSMPAARTLALPVTVGALVGSGSPSLADLLRRSVAARRVLTRYLSRPAPAAGPVRHHESCVLWVVPWSWFDDDGWPTPSGAGDVRARRRDAARSWLSSHGIALVAR